MPRIPLYDPSVQLSHLGPQVEQDIKSFGMENLAMAKNWELVGQAGDKLSEMGLQLNQRLHQAKMVNDLAGMKMDTTQRLYQLRDEVQKGPDPEKWEQTFKEAGAKIFQENLERSTDAGVQAHYKTAWASHFPVMLHGVTVEARKTQIANFAGNLEENYGKSIDLFNQAGNDIEKAKIKGDAFGMIQGGVSAGFLTPVKAQKLREGFDQSVMLAAVNQEIMNDPKGAFDKLADPARYFSGMDAQTAMTLRGRAQAEMHRVQGDNALEVQKLYETKQLTPESLKAMRDGRTINLGTWKMYDAALQSDALPVKAAKDNDLYVRRWQQALAGNLPEDQVFNDLRAGAITKSEAHFLINTSKKMAVGETPDDLAFTKSPYYKAAMGELNYRSAQIDKSLWNLKPGAKKSSAKGEATMMFLDECRAAQKQGMPPGPWMLESVNKILKPIEMMNTPGAGEPPKKTWWQRTFGSDEEAGKGRQAGTPATGQGQTGIPVMNKRTGKMEHVSQAEYDLIMQNQKGGR